MEIVLDTSICNPYKTNNVKPATIQSRSWNRYIAIVGNWNHVFIVMLRSRPPCQFQGMWSKHFVALNNNNMIATSGAGTVYPSWHLSSSKCFIVPVAQSLVICVVFCRLLFVLFLLAIVLSIRFWIMASNYFFRIFKLFLYNLLFNMLFKLSTWMFEYSNTQMVDI
jgi:hypothetical protein